MPTWSSRELGTAFGTTGDEAILAQERRQQAALDARKDLPNVIGAALETENIGVASAIRLGQAARESGAKPLDGYNPFRDVQVEDPRLQGLEHAFVESRSPEETRLIKERVLRGLGNHAALDKAGGAGLAWILAASVVDPINAVPGIGEAVKARTVGGAFARGAAAAFTSGLMEEAILQGLQSERPDLDASQLKSMAAMSVMFGALGAAAKGLGRETTELLAAERVKEMSDELTHAEKVAERWSPDPKLSDEENINAWQKASREVDPEMSKLHAAGTVRGRIIEGILSLAPTRVISSPSDSARKVIKILSDSAGLGTKGERTGVSFGPSVDARVKGWRAFHLTAGLADMNDSFAAYRKAGGQEIASHREFYEAVGMAMRRGDQAASRIVDPALREAVGKGAKALRARTFDPLLNAALEQGLVHKSDLDLHGTALSYFSRDYDIGRVKGGADPTGRTFKQVLTDWIKRNPDELRSGETIDQVVADTERAILGVDKGSLRNGAIRNAGPLKDRVLRIPDREIEWFLNSDAASVASRYVRTLAGEVELARAFKEALPPEIRALQGRLDQLTNDLGDLERAGNTAQEIATSIENEKAFAAVRSNEMRATIRDAIDREKTTLGEVRGYEAQIKAQNAQGRMSRKAMAEEVESLRKEIARHRDDAKVWKSLEKEYAGTDLAREAKLSRLESEFNQRHAKKRSEFLEQHRKSVNPEDLKRVEALEEKQLEAMYRLDGVRDELKGHRQAARAFDADVKETISFSRQQYQTAAQMQELAATIDQELAEVQRKYARAAVHMEPQKAAIHAEYDEMVRNASTEKERLALQNRRKRDIDDLNLVRDRILGTAGIPENPDDFFFRASQSMKKINLGRFGGTFGVSSATDSGHVVLRYGYRNMERYLKNTLQPLKAAKKDELARLFWMAEMTHGARRSMSMADIMDDLVGGTRLEKGIHAMSEGAAKWFGIDLVNGAQRAGTSLVASDELLKLSRQAVEGTITEKKLAQMANAGIDKSMARRILKMAEHWEPDEGGKNFLPHADRWTDKEAGDVFRHAVLAMVHNTIIEPGAADLPAVFSKPVLSAMFQFKSFMFATNSKILASALNEGDMATLGAMTSLVAWGGLIYALKQFNAGRELPDSPGALIYEAVDNSGALGFLTDANNILERSTGYGLNRALGGTGPSRYQSRNAVDAILGPTIGTISDFAAAANALGDAVNPNEEVSKSGVHAARRLLPYQNMIGVRQGLNVVEGAFQ